MIRNWEGHMHSAPLSPVGGTDGDGPPRFSKPCVVERMVDIVMHLIFASPRRYQPSGVGVGVGPFDQLANMDGPCVLILPLLSPPLVLPIYLSSRR